MSVCNNNNVNKYNAKELLEVINKLSPLINKYSNKLSYTGAKTDLTIALIEIVNKMPPIQDEKIVIGYINKSIINEYIRLSKKNGQINEKEVVLDLNSLQTKENHDIDLKIDIKNAFKTLTKKQRNIILKKFFLDYTDTQIAQSLNISKQAVNKTKKTALKLIRNNLKI